LANEEEGGEQYISAKNGTRFSLGDSEVFVERFRFDGTHRFPKPSKEEKLDVDLTSFAETWKKRQEAMKAAAQASLFTSPTTLSENRELSEGAPSAAKEADKISEAYPNYMPIIGSVCHNVLEGWDFHGTKESLEKSVESAIQWIITAENGKSKVIMQRQIDDSMDQRGNRLHNFPDTILSPDTELIKAEVIKILSDFIGSEAYKELQNAHILGREIPILLKWDGQIMRGTIDILYKTDNRFIIADYKTDYVKPSDLPARAKKYQQQKEIYTEAAKRCLTIENPEFKLIFLRLGKAVFI
jgi:ATP-dependent helicase/nuclease subunit A